MKTWVITKLNPRNWSYIEIHQGNNMSKAKPSLVEALAEITQSSEIVTMGSIGDCLVVCTK